MAEEEINNVEIEEEEDEYLPFALKQKLFV